MRLEAALPATALLLAISAFGVAHTQRTPEPSPRRLLARAAMGVVKAAVGVSDRSAAPEPKYAHAPLTLSASRPDAVGSAPAAPPAAELERYHERALASARETSAIVVTREASATSVKAAAIAAFEKKFAKPARAVEKKPKCTTSALDLPIVGCYLRQATTMLVS